MRLALAATLLLLPLTGCGGDDTAPVAEETEASTPSPTPAEPTYTESDTCREDAQEVLDILSLAIQDSDVRDAAGRVATVESMLPDATATCSGDVARATAEAFELIGDALDAAMGTGRGNVGRLMVEAQQNIDDAQAGLDVEN